MCKQNVVYGECALNSESDKTCVLRRREVQNVAVAVLARSCYDYCCCCCEGSKSCATRKYQCSNYKN